MSADHALEAEVRLYESLFSKPNPNDVEDGQDFTDFINSDSLQVLTGCRIEPSVATAEHGTRYQFERLGYFNIDLDSIPERLVFNRTVTLKDSWSKIQQKGG